VAALVVDFPPAADPPLTTASPRLGLTLLREGMLISDVRADAAGKRPAETNRILRAKRRKARKDVSSALPDSAAVSLRIKTTVQQASVGTTSLRA
jgi:hypothetical protein